MTCPNGVTAPIERDARGGGAARFGAACVSCPLAAQCTTAAGGRTPEAMARMTLTTFQAAREGRFAGVDPLLAELLGEPRSAADQIAGSIAA